MAFASTISNEEAAQLPVAHFDGDIVVVEDDNALERACEYLSAQSVLGFDTETRPSFTKNQINHVALLQLSTYERCYLIRLCRLKKIGKALKLLENSRITKIGAGLASDMSSLSRLCRFTPRGFVELQSEVERFGIENKSLRKMAAIVLGERVSKAQRLSNWEASSLTLQQQHYAATDAWVCLRIFDVLHTAKSSDNIK